MYTDVSDKVKAKMGEFITIIIKMLPHGPRELTV